MRLLGLGLLRGLLDEKAVVEVAGEPDPIVTLQHRGLLEPEEATALARILDSGALPSPFPGTDGAPLPAIHGKGQSPWDSLPPAGPHSDGSGRQVLRALTLATWKHYRDLRFLAEGGMGRVFKAYDPTLKRPVALKFLRRDDPEMAARFAQEAQHQAMVEHPRICRVYEVGEWQGQSYIAMQYIEGETLDAAIPNLSLAEKIQVMEEVAEAIHAAHHARLIHRDLKPANIMVARRGNALEPTILDFGLAKGMDAEGLTQQGLAMGSVHYMAPEQVRGHHDRINRRTDVYGLGAALHKVLTGEPPFGAYEGVEVFRRTIETDVPPLRRLVPDLPSDLDTLTRKCLEKDPARRYDSALAVAEDLRRWREGEPILARRPTVPYLAAKWARRHKLVMAVGGVALLGLLVLGGFALATASSAWARVRHAQHFGQEAERIEALLRYSHLLPPHDVRPVLDQARTRMAALEQEARRAGRLATGPADYALGRGHLALGDHERAKERLE
ncbi:MAG TPA: serine/threonine-protein kinase, partial [Geothrix sp.]|nr:serine/threonine-protein kinase [Geothrix sp.]